MENQMSKILPIIDSTPATFGGSLMKIVDDGFDTISSALANWLDLATQMENYDGTNQVARRMEYSSKQNAQLWHNQMYGNRDIFQRDRNGKVLLDGKDKPKYRPASEAEMSDPGVRFSANENLAYWEARLGAYTDEQGQITLTSYHKDGSVTKGPVAEDDQQYADVMVRTEEARRWYAVVKSQYDAAVALFECLTGTTFEYEPFVRKARVVNPGVVKLAASIRHRPKAE
jgi:hypothetical protein